VIVGGPFNVWLLPTWTLAVEEQFYLLLPFIILWTPKRWFSPLILAGIVISPVLRVVITLCTHAPSTHTLPPIGAAVLLPCRWDLLFLGVLAAYVVRSPGLWQHAIQRQSMLRLVCMIGPWVIAGDLYLGDSASGA